VQIQSTVGYVILWAQSQVIQSYGSALSAYGLIFLGAHFIWAFSLMFLFSGRGYWQELIESILGRTTS
jgi:photosystem I P700 chlorophyll a apoprotein A1